MDRWTGAPSPADLPADPVQVHALLGPDFVGSFPDRLEEVFGIEVVRVGGLSTDYSFTLAGRRVVVPTAHGNWFRSNFSLAHELAHLALGHHDITEKNDKAEDEANDFANELLLPAEEMRAINWRTIDEAVLARNVWQWGVSTQAVRYRLRDLRLRASSEVRAALELKTQQSLRRQRDEPHRGGLRCSRPHLHPDAARLGATHSCLPHQAPPRRRRGRRDQQGHTRRLLNTPAEELEVDEPAPAFEMSADELMAELGLVETD